MPSSRGPNRLAVAFDDTRAVANAGLVLPAVLAQRLGIEALTRLRALPWCPAQRPTAARRA
jgi:hypothetical protein